MLLANREDKTNIVHTEWTDRATVQVRDYGMDWHIRCWAKVGDVDLVAKRVCSTKKPLDDMKKYMKKYAHDLGVQLSHNAFVLGLVLDDFNTELYLRYSEMFRSSSEGVKTALNDWARERLQNDLLSGHVDSLEIVTHTDAFMRHLYAKYGKQ